MKKVMILETGEVFNSYSSCARKINGNVADIARCLKRGEGSTHKGYHFRKVEEYVKTRSD